MDTRRRGSQAGVSYRHKHSSSMPWEKWFFCCDSAIEIFAVAKDTPVVQAFDALYLHKAALALPSAPLPSLLLGTKSFYRASLSSTAATPAHTAAHSGSCSRYRTASSTCPKSPGHTQRQRDRALAAGSCSWQSRDGLSLEAVLLSLPPWHQSSSAQEGG